MPTCGSGEQAAHFNRETQPHHLQRQHPRCSALLPGAQDRLSLFGTDRRPDGGQPRSAWPPGTRLTLQTANTRAAEPWTFTSDGEEQPGPASSVRCIALQVQPRATPANIDTRVEVWIAPSLNHLRRCVSG
jgi:hypothetical protein